MFDARYRTALPAEFCAKNPPPLYLTLYYVVTRLPDSLRVVRDHFLSVFPTTLTVDLLEERLLAAEQSIVAVGASRGDPRTPIFEGCSPSPLLPSVASAATADLGGFESTTHGPWRPPAPADHAADHVRPARPLRPALRPRAASRSGGHPGHIGGAPRPRPYFVPLLEQVLGLPPSPSPAPPFECPQPVQSQSLLLPVSPLPAPSPYTGPTGGLAERRAPASRPASPARPACTSRRTSRPRPPAVPGTHQMALRPSTAPLRVPLPSPPTSSLPAFTDPKSDSLRAASPTVARFLATVVTNPSLASTAASALVAELVDFAASCRLDYATSLVAESASVCPPSVGGECALSTNVLEDRQEEFQCFAAALPHLVSTLLAPEGDPDAPDIPTPRSYAEAIEGPYSSQWQAAMDAEMASWKSTGTYVDEVPPPGANIVSGMWIFRVKRPPGSPPVFKARSSLYTLTTAPPIPASGQVAASSQVFAAASRSSPASAPCSCRPLAHETLLWHHRLGHPSLPRLRGMASRALVSGLPRSLPPLPPGPASTCVPCVEGRQRAAPHSSSFPPIEAPLQTLRMDVQRWGVFLRPPEGLLSFGGHPPDVHASGLLAAKRD
ncbi:unnamed protein product, partial [Closterium sp. NIES-53]